MFQLINVVQAFGFRLESWEKAHISQYESHVIRRFLWSEGVCELFVQVLVDGLTSLGIIGGIWRWRVVARKRGLGHL